VLAFINYSTITDYSEDVTRRKGDIRAYTNALLLGKSMPKPTAAHNAAASEAPARTGAQGTSRETPRLEPGRTAAAPAQSSSSSLPFRQEKGELSLHQEKGHTDKQSSSSTSLSRPSRLHVPRPGLSPPSDAKEILLVDEVDVFFGKDFYGQTHNQVCRPCHYSTYTATTLRAFVHV